MLAFLGIAGLAIGRPAPAEDFQPGCTLPFDQIKSENLEIDAECGIEGAGGSDEKVAENRAKNNFCATGSAASLSFVSFKKLQQKTDEGKADGVNFKADRTLLREIHTTSDGDTVGEGSRVRFAAFVLKADHSNHKKDGEKVNCNRKGRPFNDVHIALVEKSTTKDQCKSVTAEISPHFRPDDWTPGALKDLKDLKKPVRITGQLFFDSSHAPCHDGVKPNPKRQSVWEIHPAYRIEVCSVNSLSACNVNTDSKWTDLDVWLAEHAEEMPDE